MVSPQPVPAIEPEPIPIFSPRGALALFLLIPGLAAAVVSANPMATVLRQSMNKLLPAEMPDPSTAITMRLKGQLDDTMYQEIMIRWGLSNDVAVGMLAAAEQILGPGELLGMLLRGVIAPDRFASELARLGVSEESASNLAQMAETLLPPDVLIRAKFRGAPIAGSYESEMTRQGFTTEAARTYEEASKIIGGPSDMIRWAVREVFTPEIVQELGLGDEFPSEFVEQAAKIGMEEEVASNEWKAHWVLPSIGQAYEMLHRRAKKRDGSTFDIEDMERLLRVQDVMPFFRGMITQIAYTPFTRVDVRRMHKMGVLNREETKSAYMDRGFDDDKAEKMTEFTVQFNTESERDLTKTEILRAFARGVIDESMTVDLLSDVGIPVEAAGIIIATQLAKVEMDTTDELADIEIDRYIDGLITEDELQDVLVTLTLTAPQIELLLAKSRRKKRRSRRLPSAETVVTWYKADLIEDARAHDLLDRLGYDPPFRSLMLGKKERLPSRADILSWFDRKLITNRRATTLLSAMGYAQEVIDLLLEKPTRKPSKADIARWLKTGLINEPAAREFLADLEFAPDLIDLYILEALGEEEE